MKKLALGLALLACCANGWAQKKRSLSVEDFDYSTVMTETQAIFGTQVNLGAGINAMLVKRVAQGGKFTVVERKKVQTLIKEQDFGASGRVKQGTQARVGQIRGADYTLMGDIVTFGRDDKRKSAVVGAAVPGAGGIVGGHKNDFKAVVTIDYRLVDNETSEVIATGEARGESTRQSKGFGAALFLGGVFAGGALDMSSSNFGQTIIGEAVMDAVNKLADDLNTKGGGAAVGGAKQVEVDARIANVNGSTVYINAGSNAGVAVGDKLQVFRLGKEIKDPTTGEVLDTESSEIGELVVTQVKEKISIAAYTGSTPPKIGDAARK